MAENLERQSLIWPLRSIIEPIDLNDLFSREAPLEMELGSGDGSFMLEYARRNPDREFLAVERLLGRLRKLDRKASRTGLANLALLRIEAAYLVKYLLPERSLDTVHIYFPDPWPKKKHHKNRLINREFVEQIHPLLKPAGLIFLRTDNVDYFDQMVGVFGDHDQFQRVETPPSLVELKTDFERQFNDQGTPTRHAAYQASQVTADHS